MSVERNCKMTIAYDGTHYSGWQVQPNGISIQEKLQEVLQIILRHPVVVVGSGRTDAGVHALGQVAHFKHEEEIDFRRLLTSLNGLLPPDIRVKSVEAVPPDFHAQHGATSKTYYYHLNIAKIPNPFRRLYSLHVYEACDLEALRLGAKHFIGTHDFTSFANEAHTGCAAHDPFRTIKRLDAIPEEGGIRLEFEGDGFLYKMVRNITGTLLEVAAGKRDPDEIPRILKAKDRRQAGKAAPPHGLFLAKVDYPE